MSVSHVRGTLLSGIGKVIKIGESLRLQAGERSYGSSEKRREIYRRGRADGIQIVGSG